MTKARRSLVRRWSLPLLLVAACGGPQKLGGAGATCFRDDDCEPGLVCVAPVEQPIARVCSNDPTPLISTVDRPPPAVGGSAAMAGSTGVAGANAGGGMAPVGGGGVAGAMAVGGTDTGGTDTGGTDTGGTDTGGTDTGGTDTGGTSGAGTGGDAGTGGTTAGTASEAGAPP